MKRIHGSAGAPGRFRIRSSIVLLLLLSGLWSAPLVADTAYFSAQVGADMITVAAQMRHARETAYVALDEIMHQIGGVVAVQPDRVQANWGGTTALLSFNDVSVRLPGQTFSLIHPVRQQGDMVFISLADVPAFFSTTFNLPFSQVEQVESPRAVTLTPIEPDETSLDMLDDSLLETLDDPSVFEEADVALEPEMLPEEEQPPAPEEGADEDAEEIQSLPETMDLSAFAKVGGSIVLDAGHGGQDNGAVGGNGLNEKEVTLGVALRVRDLLTKNTAIKVQLTRDGDKELSLSNRRTIAQTAGGNFFISLHAGFSVTPRAQGVSIFTDQGVQSAEGRLSSSGKEQVLKRQQAAERAGTFGYRLAQGIGENSILGNVLVRSCPLLLQRELDMPVVLIEVAYLSNIDAATLLSEEEYQEQVALALAWAVANAMKQR